MEKIGALVLCLACTAGIVAFLVRETRSYFEAYNMVHAHSDAVAAEDAAIERARTLLS